MKLCYIAGKIGNLPEAEWQANFAAARQEVLAMGMRAICPTQQKHEHDKSWQSYMREDLTALLSAACVYAQRNWEDSPGATIEINLAKSLNIPVIYQK